MKSAGKKNPPNVAELAEILGTTDISKICGVTTQTVQSWIDRGVLKAFRTPGGHRRVKREDFIEFLEKFQFPAAAKTQSSRQRVLVADDEPDLLESIKDIVEESAPDANITLCSTGAEALIQLGLSRPDLAILDVFMPGLSGIQILDRILKTPEFKHTKVVIITAHKDEETDEKALLQRGAAAVLFKPFSTADLKKEIEEILKSAKVS